MVEIIESEAFRRWRDALRDAVAQARIRARLRRAEQGNLGDWKSLSGGVCEMRIDHGPGYRVYFIRRGDRLIVILGGGIKRSQSTDIAKAIQLAKEWE